MAMNRAQFRKQLQEGLNAVFGMSYRRYPQEWTTFLDVETSNKAWEEDVLLAGLGAAQLKDEGGGVAYDEGGEAWTARYVIETIALAFAITEEAEEDGLYGNLGAKYSAALATSMRHTKEINSAAILNNGWDVNYPGGDGKPLFATDHPLWGGGTLSNTLPTPADLSETALEDMLIRISRFVDDRGIPLQTRGLRLLVDPSNEYEAERILMSPGRSGTADNDINAMRSMGRLPGGFAVLHYLTDPDSFFIKTDCPDGLKMMSRLKIRRGLEGDFNTGNMRYKARERYKPGFTDPRGAFGSQGGGA